MQNSDNEKKPGFPKSILIILLTIISACAIMVCGYIIINHFVSDESASSENTKQEAQANKEDEKDSSSSLADEVLKNGGSLLVYSPDVEDTGTVTDEDIKIAMELLRVRLDAKGYVEATIESDDSRKITVAIPGCEVPDDAADFLKASGKLEFLDAYGNVIMDGSPEYIIKAEPKHGQTSEYSENQYYVQLNFTDKGQVKFKEATAAAVAAGGDKQYISVAIDGIVQMSPRVGGVIDSESCVITSNYSQEEAESVASLINSGLLPFDLKIVKFEYIEG